MTNWNESDWDARNRQILEGIVARQAKQPRRRGLSSVTRLAVLERDHWRCHYCGKALITAAQASAENRRLDQYEIDHIVPVIDGGSNAMSNLVAACLSCNRRKCATPYEQYVRGE